MRTCEQIFHFPHAKDGEVTSDNRPLVRILLAKITKFCILVAIVNLREIEIGHVLSSFHCINKQDQLKAILPK